MIIALLVIGLVVAASLAGLAYRFGRKSQKLADVTEEELRQFIAEDEARRIERAEFFGDNIYDVYRPR